MASQNSQGVSKTVGDGEAGECGSAEELEESAECHGNDDLDHRETSLFNAWSGGFDDAQ